MRFAFFIAAISLAIAAPAAADAPCSGGASEIVTVASIRDGRTLLLADGRELRLAGLEPGLSPAPLEKLIAGQRLTLQQTRTDRYGRLVAFAFREGDALPLQTALLEQGEARMSARVTPPACAGLLATAERKARAARRGLWADPNFAPISSQNLTMITAARGQFALIEGPILSVRESGATIYMNFGRRFTRDFAVTMPKRESRAFAAAGLDPKTLQGRRVLVRGVVEQRSGPVIGVTAPTQIEVIN